MIKIMSRFEMGSNNHSLMGVGLLWTRMEVKVEVICVVDEDRAVFIRVSKSNWFCVYYATRLVQKNSRHFFIQSGVKPKPIVIHSYAFSLTLRQLHVITSCFDWFT